MKGYHAAGWRLHPRACLLCMGLLSSCAIYFQDMLKLAAVLVIAWGLLVLQLRLCFCHALLRIFRYGLFMSVFFLFLLLFNPWEIVAGDMLRCLVILSLPFLLQDFSQRELLQALLSLGVPQTIAFMLQVAISFYPLFLEQVRDLWQSVQLRGLALQQLTAWEKLRLYLSLLFPLLGGTLRRARGLSASLEARGMRAGQERTIYPMLPMAGQDYCVLLFLAAVCLWLVYGSSLMMFSLQGGI